jgi:hypothetical protein
LIFAYLMLALLPIAAVVYIIWDHKRKVAQREAASSGRMEELLGVAQHAPRGGGIEPSLAPAEPMPVSTFVLRERFLSAPQTLLYYLLKTGLPDYLVVAQVPVASLLDPAPSLAAYAREEQARMFARHIVDFAILDKSTRPVAVINLGNVADHGRAASLQMKAWMSAAGLRYVELDATALPRKDAVRALVLGDESANVGRSEHTELSR